LINTNAIVLLLESIIYRRVKGNSCGFRLVEIVVGVTYAVEIIEASLI
jgi:hypothetical protein